MPAASKKKNKQIPVVDYRRVTASNQQPIQKTKTSGERVWTFSFKYFRQKNHFGFDKATVPWFVSILERLSNVSLLDVDALTFQPLKEAYHYHKVNWKQKNIPIQRADFDWVDEVYRDNDTDYPFYQFYISGAMGRIVGFFDEKKIFNVLFFDRYHNIQPLKSVGYRVTSCFPEDSEIEGLRKAISGLASVSHSNCGDDCGNREHIAALIEPEHEDAAVVYVSLETHQKIFALLNEGRFDSVDQLIEYGIEYEVTTRG